jgi:hypothetical protein
MTFTFRLSRRLALHLVGATLVLSACQDAQEPDASSQALQVEAASTPSPSPLGPNSTPNEPAGYVRFAENDLSTLPSGLWKPGGQAGQWSWFPVGDPDLTLGATTVAGMASSPDFMSTRFRSGIKGGNGPVNFGGWESTTKQKSKVYLSIWIRIRGTGYENHPVGTKMGFLSYGDNVSQTQNQGFFILQGYNGQGVKNNFNISFNQQNIVTRNLIQNVNSSRLFTAGPWHHFEAVFEVNTIGQSNGRYKLWIDGVKVSDYNNVMYITSSKPNKFNYWKWNPTWGGMGGTRTRNDFIDIDHVYMSGLP